MDEYAAVANLLYEVGLLKRYKRTGWQIAGVPDPESVADHTARTAMIAAVVAALEGHDPQRAAFLALWHDTQETRTMDIPYVGRTVLEATPNVEITESQVDGTPAPVASMIKAAVAEYETRESPESACAKDADRLDCLFQALEYRASGNGNMRSWIESSLSGLNTASAKRIADAALHASPLDWVDQALE
jgi:putative hydrolase of HD superfamily